MLSEERRRKILEALGKYGQIQSKSVSEDLGVSEVTIRSDLAQLEDEGLLRRVRGGAVSIQAPIYDPQFQVQIAVDVEEKKEIAKKAVKFVGKNDVIFIDSGSTTLFFTEELVKNLPINVSIVTNSLYVINTVAQYPAVNLIVLGGVFQYNSFNFIDLDFKSLLGRYHVNKLFFAINALDEDGTYSSNILDASVKKQLYESTNNIYILCSTSKLFKKSLMQIHEWAGHETLITNSLPEDHNEKLMRLASKKKINLI